MDHHSRVRAIQATVRSRCDIEIYEKIRDQYHANGVFPHIADKVLSPPMQQSERGPDPFWRWAAFYHRLRNPSRGI